jgi:hypothetical protein
MRSLLFTTPVKAAKMVLPIMRHESLRTCAEIEIEEAMKAEL